MTNFVIEPTMDTLGGFSNWWSFFETLQSPTWQPFQVQYDDAIYTPKYRTVSHDVILVYGFVPKGASQGIIKAKFRIEDGLRKGSWIFQIEIR